LVFATAFGYGNKTQAKKAKINKQDYIKLKTSVQKKKQSKK